MGFNSGFKGLTIDINGFFSVTRTALKKKVNGNKCNLKRHEEINLTELNH